MPTITIDTNADSPLGIALDLQNVRLVTGSEDVALRDVSPTDAESIIKSLDMLTAQTHGVPTIDGVNGTQATYANTGDTYAPTWLYDHEDGAIYREAWGDWIERKSEEHGRELCGVCGAEHDSGRECKEHCAECEGQIYNTHEHGESVYCSRDCLKAGTRTDAQEHGTYF